MPHTLRDYLDPAWSPRERPSLELCTEGTRELHHAIDAAIRRRRIPFLHPEDPTLQLDMLGSRHMTDWQERKVESVFSGEQCWSELHQFYARYGVESARDLISKVRQLENAAGALLTDCGMQAVALTFDIVARRGGHAILLRGVYNKTRRYLEWLAERIGFEVTIVDEGDLAAVEQAIRPQTFLIFAETYTNPLMRALDCERLGALAREARQHGSKSLTLVIDNTIATPWGVKTPILDHDGVDILAASGTKALAGQDRDLWGYIASNRIDFLNEAMDLQAMRGGALDWRRNKAIQDGLEDARDRFEQRTRTASEVAGFLSHHPRVDEVFHPSLEGHPDREVIDAHYTLPGSIVSFKIADADEDSSRHFADVLATCIVLRYAGSFDGLTTKVNHHRTVSEYFTEETELRKANIDRVIRLGIGIEAAADVEACLNWALWHYTEVTNEEVLEWQRAREKELNIPGDR